MAVIGVNALVYLHELNDGVPQSSILPDIAAVDRARLDTVMLEDGVIDWASPLRALDDDMPVLLEYPIARDAVAGQLARVRAVA
ncbi:hypothetical protein JS533_010825 [Bifidobacterium amazonense]|uniref:DUF2442 domain-containing protein n=1 Tax=Bifidobacterium amazonense TaxID=2809027 RepID=A0ABS9VXF3_9BIFI|nr:hypothetical protein [Bifidobacterium amazonense]MCH9276759.1 hypothetical protein [Bifidobacterium amazonense]